MMVVICIQFNNLNTAFFFHGEFYWMSISFWQEYQEQAQKVFQQKLNEIATPTPYSEKAMQHMEMRRQSSSDDSQPPDKDPAGTKNKIWVSVPLSLFSISGARGATPVLVLLWKGGVLYQF